MRAARLLQMLLLLQNRGRMTSVQLAGALEVSRRTILRDVDALTEAGLPIIVHQGNQGGIELGFNYRTRLTGLAADEAEALGIILGGSGAAAEQLGMGRQARRTTSKLLESLPDRVRGQVQTAMRRFRFEAAAAEPDPRLPAMAEAVRDRRIVTIRARSGNAQRLHPRALVFSSDGWLVDDGLSAVPIPLSACGDINISARTFEP